MSKKMKVALVVIAILASIGAASIPLMNHYFAYGTFI